MVLNDSSTITEKSRTDLLVDYLDREGGPFKNHLYIGLGQVTYRREGDYFDCNIGQGRVQICLQSWFKRGPNIPAISVSIGTIYACNLENF